jgi:hypothetical protein
LSSQSSKFNKGFDKFFLGSFVIFLILSIKYSH